MNFMSIWARRHIVTELLYLQAKVLLVNAYIRKIEFGTECLYSQEKSLLANTYIGNTEVLERYYFFTE